MARVIPNSALLLDELGHTATRPEFRVVPQGAGPPLETRFDLPQLAARQERLPTGPARLAQAPTPFGLEGGGPPADGLSVNIEPASHLGLADALAQERGRLKASLLERLKIASDSGWISHDRKVAYVTENVTILCEPQ